MASESWSGVTGQGYRRTGRIRAGVRTPRRGGRRWTRPEPSGLMLPMIGLLHPGEMGSAVGARLCDAGHDVGWASEGRGVATKARAEAAGLVDAGTLADLVRASDV